jgi:hypothetical protein
MGSSTTSQTGSSRPRRRQRTTSSSPTSTPTRTNGQFFAMQQRVVLGGEPMHLTIYGACCAVVPSGSKAQQRHVDWHRTLQEAIEEALPR